MTLRQKVTQHNTNIQCVFLKKKFNEDHSGGISTHPLGILDVCSTNRATLTCTYMYKCKSTSVTKEMYSVVHV
jgi:hypothetical protein